MKTSSPIFFDTNILIYNQDKSSQFYKIASKWHNKALTGEINAVLSSQNLLEFAAVMTNPNKITHPLTQKYTATEINKYIDTDKFEIIYPNNETLKTFSALLKKYPMKNPRQIFDLFLVATMISNDLYQILTLNKQDFQFKEVKVVRKL